MFSQRGHGGLYVHYGCAGHLNLFTGLSNWTKRLVAHPRGRSICFSSGQSGSCAGTQSTVNILWGLGKNTATGRKELKIRVESKLDMATSLPLVYLKALEIAPD